MAHLVCSHLWINAKVIQQRGMGSAQHLKIDPPQSNRFQPGKEMPPPAVVLGYRRGAPFGWEQPSIRATIRQHLHPLPNPIQQPDPECRQAAGLESLRGINLPPVDALLYVGV